jgi:GxxExxY protein
MSTSDAADEERIYSVVGAFYEVHRTLGYGFLEHVYQRALEHELALRGHVVRREVHVPVHYKGMQLGTQRIDHLVDECLVLELKSTYELPPTTTRQTFNYLRAAGLRMGLVLHFGPEARFYRVPCSNPAITSVRVGNDAPQ